MKLASVTFHRPRKLGRMEIEGDHVTEDDVDSLRFDEATQCVVVGSKHIPREEVKEMEPVNLELVCDECGKDVANAQALGSHKRHKHAKESA